MRHDYTPFLRAAKGIPFERNAPMHGYTTLRIGGPADLMISPNNEDALLRVVTAARDEGLPLYMLGNGSNLLVSDEGIRGVVVKLGEGFSTICADGSALIAGAGARLTALARESLARGLMGLEWASGIPGTLGGAIAMNAGAYDSDMKRVAARVRYIEDGEIYERAPAEEDFSYRASAFAAPQRLVLNAVIALSPDDGMAAERVRDYTARRSAKQPLKALSAGSTFKRPPGHYAGALIEGAGLKGAREGGAMVSDLHAGFLINTGGATARDMLRLIARVQKEVFHKYGVMLERELKLWPEQTEQASL